jgi:hypothetical protein
MSHAAAYETAEFQSTPQARAAAEFLIDEVKAHRLDPVVSIVPVFESVHVTVKPDTDNAMQVWATWVNLFRVNDSKHRRTMSTGHGTWQGVPIVLVGIDPQDWRPAEVAESLRAAWS